MAAAGGPAYAAAYDRTGADARGITAAFLYRTDRLSLAGRRRRATRCWARHRPCSTGLPGLPANADVQNPKALNAVLPADVDTLDRGDGANVFTRAPQVGQVHRGRRAGLGGAVHPLGGRATTTPPARTAGSGSGGSRRATARRSSPRSRRPTRPPGWSTAGT